MSAEPKPPTFETWPTGFHVHHVHEMGAYRVGFGNERLYQLRLLCEACHDLVPNKFSEEQP